MLRIRNGTKDDREFLVGMLYEAACWRACQPRPAPSRVLANPHIARYIADWGRPDDTAVIAEVGDPREAIGGAWFRLLVPPEQGYGFVSAEIPEITIGVLGAWRGRGVGGALLRALICRARELGYRALSLSVEFDNPAVRLYEQCGFDRVGTVGTAWTMLHRLDDSAS